MTIRTAFTLPDRRRWTGGYQYFVNLFRVLSEHGRGQVTPVVFVPEDCEEGVLAPLNGAMAEIVRSRVFSGSRAGMRLANAMLGGSDRAAAGVYREHEVKVVFESACYHGWRFPYPTIAWLPDFQHRRLPAVFSRLAWVQREAGFRAQIASARAIMLSSEASRAECEAYYPASRGRTRVVRFAAALPAEALSASENPAAVHGLPAEYFYLPNQFWAHKNHRVVIDALAVLRARSVDVTVAASGAAVDYRHPRLLQELEAKVAGLGLQKNFRFLGLVPRADVYGLMRRAAAVVNPSLSEGWSTAVEEARALGVRMVLSDIAVHREQAADAIFFDPHSADSAADAIEQALRAARAQTGKVAQISASTNGDRLRAFAWDFESLVQEAAS